MNVFVAGSDRWACAMAARAVDSGCQIYANKDNAKILTQSFGKSKAVTVVTGAPHNSKAIDAVILSNSLKKRADMAAKYTNSGKNTVCRGPLGRTAGEVTSVLDAAKKGGAKIIVAQGMEYEPAYKQAATQLEQGKIGTLGFFKTHITLSFPADHPNEGIVLEALIDDLDWIAEELGPVKTVFAHGVKKRGSHSPEYVMITLTLKSGVLGQLIASRQKNAQARTRLELCGTAGMVQFDSAEAPIEVRSEKSNVTASPIVNDAVHQQWIEFEKLIDSRASGLQAAAKTIYPLRIAEAVQSSMKHNRPVNV